MPLSSPYHHYHTMIITILSLFMIIISLFSSSCHHIVIIIIIISPLSSSYHHCHQALSSDTVYTCITLLYNSIIVMIIIYIYYFNIISGARDSNWATTKSQFLLHSKPGFLIKYYFNSIKYNPFPPRLAKTGHFVILLCLTRQFYASKESLWVGKG